MNIKSTSTGTNIRAGVISLLVVAIGYFWVTGISDLPRAWLFIISVAICFVLTMQSLVDLFVWTFGLAAAFSGRGFGSVFRLIRNL